MEVAVADHETAKKTVEKAKGLVETAEVFYCQLQSSCDLLIVSYEPQAEVRQAEAEVTSASQQGSAEDNAEKIEEQRKTLREDLKAKKNKLTEVKV